MTPWNNIKTKNELSEIANRIRDLKISMGNSFCGFIIVGDMFAIGIILSRYLLIYYDYYIQNITKVYYLILFKIKIK